MGIALVKLALDDPRPISHAGRLAVVVMALHCRDKDDPPTYWAGHAPIARALGRDDVGKGASSDAAKRALRSAVAAGYIRLKARPHRGRATVYTLHLWTECGALNAPHMQGADRPATGELQGADRPPKELVSISQSQDAEDVPAPEWFKDRFGLPSG